MSDQVGDLRRRYRGMRDSELIDLYQRAADDLQPEAKDVLASIMHEKGIFVPSDPTAERRAASAADARFPKVYFARRLNADTLDGVLGIALLVIPMLLVSSRAELLPDPVCRLAIVGLPAAILYTIFRDAIGKGTSLGKRAMGLRLVDLQTGAPCSARSVRWRNVLDLVPFLNLIDFVLMCVDARGQKIMDKQLRLQLVDHSHLDPPPR